MSAPVHNNEDHLDIRYHRCGKPKRRKKPPTVLEERDQEYYLDSEGNLIKLPMRYFFSTEGMRKHLPLLLRANFEFLLEQARRKRYKGTDLQQVKKVLKYAYAAPASDPRYEFLAAEWMHTGALSVLFLGFVGPI